MRDGETFGIIFPANNLLARLDLPVPEIILNILRVAACFPVGRGERWRQRCSNAYGNRKGENKFAAQSPIPMAGRAGLACARGWAVLCASDNRRDEKR